MLVTLVTYDFFSWGNLSGGGKKFNGSLGANNANKFGGRYCVIVDHQRMQQHTNLLGVFTKTVLG